MKKIFIAISALLMLSGCITSMEAESEYRKQCKQLKEPYVNQEFFNKFVNERNLIVINKKTTECFLDSICTSLVNRNRWETIKLQKSENEYVIYYRDYSFKNCREDIFGIASYENKMGKFCLGTKKEEDSFFKVKYETGSYYLYQKNLRYVESKYDKIYYDNEIILDSEAIIYQAPTAHDTCNSNKKIYEILLNNI